MLTAGLLGATWALALCHAAPRLALQHPPHALNCVRSGPAGTRVPRVELAEMGPSFDLEVRRSRAAPADLEKEATKQPKLTKKKVGDGGAESLGQTTWRGWMGGVGGGWERPELVAKESGVVPRLRRLSAAG